MKCMCCVTSVSCNNKIRKQRLAELTIGEVTHGYATTVGMTFVTYAVCVCVCVCVFVINVCTCARVCRALLVPDNDDIDSHTDDESYPRGVFF